MSRPKAKQNATVVFDSCFQAQELTKLFDEKIGKSRTIGVDGVRAEALAKTLPDELVFIRKRVLSGQYKFTKYKERLISKGQGKPPRVISIPTVRDRLTLRAVCNFLARIFPDAGIQKPHVYIKDIRKQLINVSPNAQFLRIDVKDYYGTINQKKLMSRLRRTLRLPEALDLIHKAIRTGTGSARTQEAGIPQGLSISNILASIFLADCDKKMREKWTYYRYVDDILVICEQSNALQAHKELTDHLRRKKLKAHELNFALKKSYIVDVSKGVEYLGFHITPSRISVRESSYKKMFSTITRVITGHKYKQRLERVLWRLNLKVTGCRYEGKNFGWMFFFLQTDDVRQLARLDNFIRLQLKKNKLGAEQKRVKSFVKAYHEIRYNLLSTTYIPDFDNYSVAQMRDTIKLMRGDIPGFETSTDDEVRRMFFSTIGHEVGELEKDLMESVS